MLRGRLCSTGRVDERGREHLPAAAYRADAAVLDSICREPHVNLAPPRVCPEPTCGSCDVVEDWHAGAAVCLRCGLVVEEQLLDPTPKWRVFEEDRGNNPQRVSVPRNPLLVSGPGTDIQNGPGAHKLRRAHNKHALSKQDRLMTEVMSRVDHVCVRLGVPGDSVGARAKEIFKSYSDILTHGREEAGQFHALRKVEVDRIVAASMLLACRATGGARSFLEIEAVTRVRKSHIRNVSQAIEAALPTLRVIKCASAEDFVLRFSQGLQLPWNIAQTAKETAVAVKEWDGLCGRNPNTIAAAVIYLVCENAGKDHRRTLSSIKEVTGVAPNTIRSATKVISGQMTDTLHLRLQGTHPGIPKQSPKRKANDKDCSDFDQVPKPHAS